MTGKRCAARALALVLACAAAGAEAGTTPAFSTAPMLVDGRLPAPDVVLSIDGPRQPAQFPRMVQDGFGAERAPDASMRLGWQAAGSCEALPDSGALCHGVNAPQRLDEGRRTELARLTHNIASINTGQREDSSAAPSLLAKARDYLQGAAQSPRSGCRKSFVLLATPYPDEATTPDAEQYPAAPSIRRIDTAASDATRQLSAAVDTLLAQSQSLPTQTIASLTAASTPASAAGSAVLFASRYDAARWSSEVAVRLVDGNGTGPAPWGRRIDNDLPHTSASLLDQREPSTRVIFTSAGSDNGKLSATPFRWAQLAPWQKAALDNGDSLGPQRLDYLRGERAGEQSHGGSFRDRDSRQGDSVNSGLWHLPGRPQSASESARAPMLFLGSNGGMLHAFSADTGAELFAYVPQGAYAGLASLTRPSYRHQYLVDGSPWTADMAGESGRSRTLLAGFMGAGGRGYFVLDVTDPIDGQDEGAAAPRVVVLDTSAGDDPDIGLITATPVRETTGTWQIARLNNGRWALIIGNGYASGRQQAVLLVQFLDGPRELLKLPAGAAGNNGLSAARLADLDGDQTPDIAYAGDLQGRLWKFDLASRDPGQWTVALGGKALLTARDSNGKAQPITAAPLVVPHPAGGRMVVFGTGRLLDDADRGDDATQSVYGILDTDDNGLAPADRSSLVQQAIASKPVGTTSGRTLWTSSDNPAPTKAQAASRGWFLDLPVTGERIVANPQRFEGKLIDVLSIAPSAAFRQATLPESCEPPATRLFRTTLNALDGTRPRSQLYGEPGASLNASRIELGSAPTAPVKSVGLERNLTFDGTLPPATRRRLDFVARRAGWRQLQ
ncbi:MAG: hypothetical protein JSS56_08010 [Proteobacteria bacterium]|nr:hypothetical protein [Pseudomonadota bacterium]